MRILLISANTATAPSPVYPLGMARLAGALTAAGHEVRQFDLLVHRDSALAQAVKTAAPQLIGISLRNIDNLDIRNPESYLDSYRTLVATLGDCTTAPIVLGGSAFSLFPHRLMEELAADYGIVGPGEPGLLRLARYLSGSDCEMEKPIDDDHHLVHTQSSCVQAPTPLCRTQHDDDLIAYYWRHGGMIGLQTKRGCHRRCIYCTYPLVDGASVIHADAAEVADEFERLHRNWGVRYIFMVDSVFNVDKAQEMAIAEALIRRDLPVSWGAFFSPADMDDDYIQTLIRSGLTHMEFGTDSLCDTVLDRLDKGFGFEDVLRTAETCARLDVNCAHYLAFGGPGETFETIDTTLERARRITPCVFFPYVAMRLFPRTALHGIAVEEGLVDPHDDLLEPTFYLAPGLEPDDAWKRIRARADGHRWVLPEQIPRIQPMLQRFRQQGRAGPLWEDLIG